jgi:hypothetical protein
MKKEKRTRAPMILMVLEKAKASRFLSLDVLRKAADMTNVADTCTQIN